MKLRDISLNATGSCVLYFEEGLDGVEVSIDQELASQCVSAALLAFAESLAPGMILRPSGRHTEPAEAELDTELALPPITNIRPPARRKRGGPPPSDLAGTLSEQDRTTRDAQLHNDARMSEVLADVSGAALSGAPVSTVVQATNAYLDSLHKQAVIRGFSTSADGEDVKVEFLRNDGIRTGGTLTSERRGEKGVGEFFEALRSAADMAPEEFGEDE